MIILVVVIPIGAFPTIGYRPLGMNWRIVQCAAIVLFSVFLYYMILGAHSDICI